MESELVDDLEELIERVWTEEIRKDFPKKAYYEADLVASFYYHLRILLEGQEKKYDVRLSLERPVLRPKNSRKKNDLHIISCKAKLPTLMGFEFKCRKGIMRRHLKGDISKLKVLYKRRIKRGYLCVVDLEKKSSKNGVRNGMVGEFIRNQRLPEAAKRSFYRLAYGTGDGDGNSWGVVPFSKA